jgi:prophage maintenance system killer protein
MLTRSFAITEFIEATEEAVPTVLAYDADEARFVIGTKAWKIASGLRPVVQDFKWPIGESDPMFEGRYEPVKGTRPSRLWEVRPEAADKERWISTKEVVRVFLKEFLSHVGSIPQQLIIGIPASSNQAWVRQYRAHLVQVLGELGHPDPQFFPEPFAVFQYYRHVEKLIPASGQPLRVLVVDFGGGTLDSCVIETTQEGNLARGGSTMLPLGIRTVTGAGKAVDRRLVELAVAKCTDPKLKQESPESRIAARPWVLLAAEEMKIALSQRMHDCRLTDDCGGILEKREYKANWYCPDAPVNFELNGNDLRRAVEELWFDAKSGFGRSILGTLEDVRFRGGVVRVDRIDKVILAGGSSGLPFLRELLYKTLSGLVHINLEDIVVGPHCEKAVAYGVAVEAAEERNRSLKTHHSIGPCVFNELFLFTAPRRDEQAIRPTLSLVRSQGLEKMEAGTLLSGPTQLGGFQLEYEVRLSYRPHGSLFYWFTDRAEGSDPRDTRLNIEQDILRLPPQAGQQFRLRITFDDKRGMLSPEFIVGAQTLQGAPFSFGGLRIADEVHSYAGIDFGTSNCYAVNLWAVPKTKQSTYPEFTVSQTAGARLRDLELRVITLKEAGHLTQEATREFADKRATDFIFHSIKIEGSPLTRGTTEDLLAGREHPKSKEAQEPINVRAAYEFAVDHADYMRNTPGVFIRELNKITLHKIDERGGTFRTGPVKISGMDYQPPEAALVPDFMGQLATELKEGPQNKSVVQFAAEMHSKLTSIHPFVDGNGRTARLLMNAILMDAGLPPIVISHGDKQRYLECLATSNKGDISALCILFAESLDSTLEELERGSTPKEPVEEPPVPQITQWVPSQDLADIMEKRIARLPVDRKARYDAWRAGFEALREEVRSTSYGFNELYGHALYHVELTRYDTLPFEKYEGLLRRISVPKTWLMSTEISSDQRSERFVFFFRSRSHTFHKTARKNKQIKPMPPADVTLCISRGFAGMNQMLRDEPIRLREIAYNSGEWLFLLSAPDQTYTVESMAVSRATNLFLRDAIAAFL